MRVRFVAAIALCNVLARAGVAIACPACVAGGLGDGALTVKLVGAFLALPFALAALLVWRAFRTRSPRTPSRSA